MPVIAGELLFAGPAGVAASDVVSAGALESSTYVTEEVEQPDTLPAASVALALNVVDVLSETETVRPDDEKLAAVPVADGAPVQAAV